MNPGARVVNSALVYVLRVRKREIKLWQREGERRRSEDLLPRSSSIEFISLFYRFLLVNFFIFYSSFVFILSLCSLLLFLLFFILFCHCHGDSYEHTPNWHCNPPQIFASASVFCSLSLITIHTSTSNHNTRITYNSVCTKNKDHCINNIDN